LWGSPHLIFRYSYGGVVFQIKNIVVKISMSDESEEIKESDLINFARIIERKIVDVPLTE
jgi:hypothetical protein